MARRWALLSTGNRPKNWAALVVTVPMGVAPGSTFYAASSGNS
jgi:hypothetical protein